jgi:hypothetical protein
MESPLAMVRGSDDIIRDTYGRPVIVVFNSKPNPSAGDELGRDVACQLGKETNAQPLEFITVSGTAKENESTRTLIRTHVMQDYKRRKLMQEARAFEMHGAETVTHAVQVGSQEESTPSFRMPFSLSPPIGSLDPFAAYPVQMQPFMYRLIHHCTYEHTHSFHIPAMVNISC